MNTDTNIDISNVTVDQIASPIEDVDTKPTDTLDPVTLIKMLMPYNPKLATKMYYQHCNVPGTIKRAGDTTYKVSAKGPWVKLQQ